MGIIRKRRVAPEETPLQEPLLQDEDRQPSKRRRTGLLDFTFSCITAIVKSVFSRAAKWSRWSLLPLSWRGVPELTLLQQERLNRLCSRVGVEYSDDAHGASLERLWKLTFPDDAYVEGKNPKWRDMGWQGDHPSSDFRGGGLLSLENLIYFAERKPLAYQRLCFKTQGKRSDWEYPFGAAGVNVTFTVAKVLGVSRDPEASLTQLASSTQGRAFLALLEVEDASHDAVFEEIYCMCFERLDAIWLAEGASYMQFPSIIAKMESVLKASMVANPKTLDDLQNAIQTKPA